MVTQALQVVDLSVNVLPFRLFNSSSLEFIGRLPKPHCLGVDVAAGLDAR